MTAGPTNGGVYAMLQAAATYAALVREPDGELRAYPGMAPGEAPHPYTTWRVLTTPTHRHMQAPAGLGEVHLQLDHWAEDLDTAGELAQALLDDLDHLGPTVLASGWELRRVLVDEAGRQLEEAAQDGTGRTFYNVQQELVAWYVRT